jgi:hypothetical protein
LRVEVAEAPVEMAVVLGVLAEVGMMVADPEAVSAVQEARSSPARSSAPLGSAHLLSRLRPLTIEHRPLT